MRNKLSEEQIASFVAAHPGWERAGEALAKTYSFADYADGIAFVVRLGFAAEKRDHHPDLYVGWRKVKVQWSTHDAGGITEKDFGLAEFADKLFAGGA